MAVGLLCSSCAGFRLPYQDTTTPLDVDLDETPVHARNEQGDVKQFRYCVAIDWDSNGIGDVAEESGMEKVCYPEYTELSVPRVWRRQLAADPGS